ncbi:hypothetical protein D3C72_1792290 [compost metagenome]
MVGEGAVRNRQQHGAGCRGDIRIRGRYVVAGDGDGPIGVGVIDVEAAVGPIVGIERHRQQPALAIGRRQRGDIEERRSDQCAVAHDPDAAGPLDHEQARIAGGRGQEDGLG